MTTIYGTPGNDYLVGDYTRMFGEDGDDTLQAPDGFPSYLNGGRGADWILGNGTNITANLGTSPEGDPDKVRIFGDDPNIRDRIIGGEGPKDVNFGDGEGHHYMAFQGGNLLVVAGGSNYITKSTDDSYTGDDSTKIELGNKPIWVSSDGGQSYHQVDNWIGTGNNRVLLGDSRGDATVHTAEGDDYIRGSKRGANIIDAGGGHNRVIGGDNADTLETNGNKGSTLLGGGGNDILISHGGSDLLEGGAGDDSLYAHGGRLSGGPGSDRFGIKDGFPPAVTTLLDFHLGNVASGNIGPEDDVLDLSGLGDHYDPYSQTVSVLRQQISFSSDGNFRGVYTDAGLQGIRGTGLTENNFDDAVASGHVVLTAHYGGVG